ncbi:MAG: RNA polymerase sigma factor [Prevotella sp.]
MKDLSDVSLVAQVAVFHNKQAFDRLVVKYQSPIRRFFLNQTLGDEQLSDDLAQDTFIKAYTNIAKFRGLSAFSTWLYRIAYNVFYDYVRRNKPSEDIDTSVAVKSSTTFQDVNLRMDVYDALGRLNDNERTCIVLQIIDGYQVKKISEITGMPSGTVKSHIFRGKEKLSTFLKQNGYDGK